MLEIFREMVKEEWRIHSGVFGSFMFALFPLMLAFFAFMGSLLLPVITEAIPLENVLLIAQAAFVLFGLSVGSFGLFGREVMNRRFGQASLLAYSSRTLPISERKIFLNFFVKDVVYYFFLWILPFVLGFAAYSYLALLIPFYTGYLLLILSLSFLSGLSIAFFLSTIYAHSGKAFVGFLGFLSIAFLAAANYFNVAGVSSLLFFSLEPSLPQAVFYLLFSLSLSSASLYFLKVDYPIEKRFFKNSLDRFSKLFSFSAYPEFVSKDFLDFSRSQGGVGKIIMSFFLPLLLIYWLLESVIFEAIPSSNLFIVFSIFLGILSSSFYNWFTEYDSFASYSFLPIKVSSVIKSKITSYLVINIISLIALIFVAVWTNNIYYLIPAFIAFASISLYALSLIIYIAGLNPNILLYNPKIFLQYLLMMSPILTALIFLSVFNPFYVLISILLIPISWGIIQKSLKKWDGREQLMI